VPFGVDGTVAAVGPIFFAIVVQRRLVDDLRPGGACATAMSVDVVHIDHQILSVAARRKGALALYTPASIGTDALLPHYDDAFVLGQFAMDDAAMIAFHLESHLEAVSLA
jgi:hypothetical protein